MSDESFARRLDEAVVRAVEWVRLHQREILDGHNLAMAMVLRDCQEMRPDPMLGRLIERATADPPPPRCWRRLFDPDYPVPAAELEATLRSEPIDNRWMIYALFPGEVKPAPEDLEGLFDAERWRRRQLTHQLLALLRLRANGAAPGGSDAVIERLCRRIAGDVRWSVAVVDLYIQRVAFVLHAGRADLIDRRWVERVIENQSGDGGWNDRWCRVFRSSRRPAFDLADPPSDQHATIQALWVLCQVRYRHAERFGLPAVKGAVKGTGPSASAARGSR